MNNIINTPKDQSDFLVGSSRSLTEDYIKGRVELHVHVFTRNTSKYCALFYPSGVHDGSLVDGSQFLHAKPLGCEEACENRCCQVGMPVFVDIVQVVQVSENLSLDRVPSIVWLIPFEHCSYPIRNTFPSASISPFKEVIRASKDGPLGDAFMRGSFGDNDKCPHQMVKSGPIVEQRITNDWIELGRQFLQRPMCPEDYLAALSIQIGRNSITLAFEKGFDLCIESFEVAIRPIHLEPRAFKERMHDLSEITYRVLFEKKAPQQAIAELMGRPPRSER